MVHTSLFDSVPLLKGVGPSTRADLAHQAVVRRFVAGQRLWSAGDEPRGLFVILEGRVRIVRMPRGRTQLLHVEGPGATLGEVPLFAGGTYPATAIADGPTRCLVLERRAIAAAMAAHPELAWLLLGRLAARVRHVLDRFESQRAEPVIARLAQYLIARAEPAPGGFTLGATQQSVAEDLGTVREVVVRLLRELAEAGLIVRTGRSRYTVRDATRLARVAAGAPIQVAPGAPALTLPESGRRHQTAVNP